MNLFINTKLLYIEVFSNPSSQQNAYTVLNPDEVQNI